MAIKNCPQCKVPNPVACKKCGCGHVFFTTRRGANTAATVESAEDISEPTTPQEPVVTRRRTARVTRERPKFYDALQVENQTRRQKALQKARKASKSDETESVTEEKEIQEKASSSAQSSKRRAESPPAKSLENPAKKRRGRPPALSSRKTTRAQILANKPSDSGKVAEPGTSAGNDDLDAAGDLHDVPPVKALQMNLVLADINSRISSSSVKAEEVPPASGSVGDEVESETEPMDVDVDKKAVTKIKKDEIDEEMKEEVKEKEDSKPEEKVAEKSAEVVKISPKKEDKPAEKDKESEKSSSKTPEKQEKAEPDAKVIDEEETLDTPKSAPAEAVDEALETVKDETPLKEAKKEVKIKENAEDPSKVKVATPKANEEDSEKIEVDGKGATQASPKSKAEAKDSPVPEVNGKTKDEDKINKEGPNVEPQSPKTNEAVGKNEVHSDISENGSEDEKELDSVPKLSADEAHIVKEKKGIADTKETNGSVAVAEINNGNEDLK